jgi:hypothetical protein
MHEFDIVSRVQDSYPNSPKIGGILGVLNTLVWLDLQHHVRL